MFDIIKKVVLTGVGLAAMTKDKVEEVARDLAKKGKLTEKEGKELVDDLRNFPGSAGQWTPSCRNQYNK